MNCPCMDYNSFIPCSICIRVIKLHDKRCALCNRFEDDLCSFRVKNRNGVEHPICLNCLNKK